MRRRLKIYPVENIRWIISSGSPSESDDWISKRLHRNLNLSTNSKTVICCQKSAWWVAVLIEKNPDRSLLAIYQNWLTSSERKRGRAFERTSSINSWTNKNLQFKFAKPSRSRFSEARLGGRTRWKDYLDKKKKVFWFDSIEINSIAWVEASKCRKMSARHFIAQMRFGEFYDPFSVVKTALKCMRGLNQASQPNWNSLFEIATSNMHRSGRVSAASLLNSLWCKKVSFYHPNRYGPNDTNRLHARIDLL